jgi:hypothetical protein
MNEAAIYRRTDSGSQPSSTLRLRALEWTALFNVDDNRNAGEIAAALRADPALVLEALGSIERMGLIEEREVALEEFLRSPAAIDQSAPDEERSLAEFLYRQTPPDSRTAPAAAGTKPLPLPFEPLQVPPPMNSRAISLLNLMQYIMSQSRDQTSGQLAVYRVFMGINTGLLRRNGITSLRFTEDRIVDDPELLDALESSLQRALGLPFPSSAFLG